ncbi:hypothetical protein [Streptomyces collinus]|uniref:hypothetical protein n=1 Tax=Streptomyces collinus TaxID=42684 RepID=UPI0036BEF634
MLDYLFRCERRVGVVDQVRHPRMEHACSEIIQKEVLLLFGEVRVNELLDEANEFPT